MVARSRLQKVGRATHTSVLKELTEADEQAKRLVERAEKIRDFAEVD